MKKVYITSGKRKFISWEISLKTLLQSALELFILYCMIFIFHREAFLLNFILFTWIYWTSIKKCWTFPQVYRHIWHWKSLFIMLWQKYYYKDLTSIMIFSHYTNSSSGIWKQNFYKTEVKMQASDMWTVKCELLYAHSIITNMT